MTSRWPSPPRWPRPSTPMSISTCRTWMPTSIRDGDFRGSTGSAATSISTSPAIPIPVCPGAHYMIGGVTVDSHGRTTLPGLWAAGEVTSSGLHGANRLASNSLLEGLVYGARAAEDIVAELDRAGPRGLEVSPVSAPTVADSQARNRPRRSDQVAARAHVAAHGHHPRRRRSERGRPPGRPLGPVYPAAGIPRSVRLDHAEHADRRPA